jgi:hypothetical protein
LTFFKLFFSKIMSDPLTTTITTQTTSDLPETQVILENVEKQTLEANASLSALGIVHVF